MFKPTKYQWIIHKAQKIFPTVTHAIRKRLINNTDFTIISNNCWGGVLYEYFGIQKNSPTIGMYFFASDYLKFIKNLKYYTSIEMKVIPSQKSKYYKKLVEMGSAQAPVGVLDDIEISLLHYHNPEEAIEKWGRRIERINWDNLIVKFSYMNECTYEMLKEFDEIDFSNISEHCKKIMFVPRPMPEFASAIYWKGFEEEKQITNDTYVFNQYFRLIPFLNDKGLIQK